jgi:hypothetical protein
MARSLNRNNQEFAWSFKVIGVLILISLLNWFLFRSFAVRAYYALIPALLAAQVFFNDLVEYLLVVKAGSTRWFSLLVSPGTILHEISHAAAAVMSGCKVTSISLFSFNKNTGVLGMVTYASSPGRLSFIRDMAVTFAPFFGCSFAAVFIAKYVFQQAIAGAWLQMDINGLFHAVWSSLGMFASQYGQIDIQHPLKAVVLYLQLCFAFGAAPSGFDFQGIASSAQRNLTGLLIAALGVAALAFLVQYPLPSGDYSTIVQDAATSILSWTVFLLILSTTLLLFSLVILYSLSLWLEAGFTGKIISPIVFAGAYFISQLGLSKTPALAVAWILFIVVLFLFRNPHLFLKEKSSESSG